MIHRRFRLPTLLAAALVMLGGACDDPMGPSDAAGTYVLQTVSDAPLPAIITDNSYARITLVADTLRLDADRSGRELVVQRFLAHGSGEPERTSSGTAHVAWNVSGGGEIQVQYVCPPGAACLFAPPQTHTGRVTDDGLVIRVGPHDYAFRRID